RRPPTSPLFPYTTLFRSQSASISSSYGAGLPTGLYGNSVPDIAGAFPRDGGVEWNGNFGTYLGSAFARVSDPQCGAVAAELKSRSEEHTSELQSPDHLVC